jgi:hypothetical protein
MAAFVGEADLAAHRSLEGQALADFHLILSSVPKKKAVTKVTASRYETNSIRDFQFVTSISFLMMRTSRRP